MSLGAHRLQPTVNEDKGTGDSQAVSPEVGMLTADLLPGAARGPRPPQRWGAGCEGLSAVSVCA